MYCQFNYIVCCISEETYDDDDDDVDDDGDLLEVDESFDSLISAFRSSTVLCVCALDNPKYMSHRQMEGRCSINLSFLRRVTSRGTENDVTQRRVTVSWLLLQ